MEVRKQIYRKEQNNTLNIFSLVAKYVIAVYNEDGEYLKFEYKVTNNTLFVLGGDFPTVYVKYESKE